MRVAYRTCCTNYKDVSKHLWAHLIRVCQEAAERPEASEEVKELREEVSVLYRDLALIILTPFNKKKRTQHYAEFCVRITSIIDRVFTCTDAQKIQTRITHQNKNLLTAIVHPDVPLTNNHAERQIRPLVITRKISGGSQSLHGARTHAVLMSVVQSISLKGQILATEINQLLQSSGHQFVTQKLLV